MARDTLDAVLVQAAKAAHGLGFDRLVRFAFVPGNDPRYRYAVRRGSVRARAAGAARTALEEIVPFLRRVEGLVRDEPPALALARRRLEDALAALGQGPTVRGNRALEARQAQEALIALSLMEPAAGRALRDKKEELVAAPSLSARWFHLIDDGSAEYRIARGLVMGVVAGSRSLLRSVLLPQREREGRWILDPETSPPDLARVGDPLNALVRLVLLGIRRHDRNVPLARYAEVGFDDLALLLSGSLGRSGERRVSLLAAALAGVRSGAPPAPARERAAELAGVGADVARLLLAAQPADEEDPGKAAWVDRADCLASLLLAGCCDRARILADRELRRRGLELLPQPLLASPASASPARLALAVLLPLGPGQRRALARAVSLAPMEISQGGSR